MPIPVRRRRRRIADTDEMVPAESGDVAVAGIIYTSDDDDTLALSMTLPAAITAHHRCQRWVDKDGRCA